MMQQRSLVISTTFYSAICSGCGYPAEEGESKSEAIENARRDGWTMRTIWPNGEPLEVFTCAICQQKTNADLELEAEEFSSFDDTPDTDAAGNCFSDADPGL
jgi:hypothetical protein